MKKKAFLLPLLCTLLLFFWTGAALADEYDELDVTVDGVDMTITSDYPSEDIPEGFTETRVYYGEEVFFGGLDNATQTVQLFYLRCDSNTSLSGFYQLDEDTMTFTRYEVVTINGHSFRPQALAAEESVLAGYEEISLTVGNTSLTAYQREGASGESAAFYLLYGSVDGGDAAWYSYDSVEQTLQRQVDGGDAETIASQEEEISNLESQVKELNNKYNKNVGRSKKLFILMAVLALLFLFLMINAMVKRAHIRLDLEERILDLKRNGGVETQRFSKRESKRNAKMDDKAAKRLSAYGPVEEEMPVPRKRGKDSPQEERGTRPQKAGDSMSATSLYPREIPHAKEEKSGRPGRQETDFLDEDFHELAAPNAQETPGPRKGVTEDMTSALMGDDEDFDFDILDLDA